jgi:hypothetical protein
LDDPVYRDKFLELILRYDGNGDLGLLDVQPAGPVAEGQQVKQKENKKRDARYL